LARPPGKSTEEDTDSAGRRGLAKLVAAAQAYKPAVAALGRSRERGLLLSLFPGFSRSITAPPAAPAAATAAACRLGCVLACTASSCKAILLPLLRSSMSLTPAPPTLSACSAPRCKDCGERLAEKGANGSRSNTRCVKR